MGVCKLVKKKLHGQVIFLLHHDGDSRLTPVVPIGMVDIGPTEDKFRTHCIVVLAQIVEERIEAKWVFGIKLFMSAYN